MAKYITISGDTWDQIAKKVYGDESYTSFLMMNNFKHLDCFVFSEGVELYTPDKPEKTDDLPEWRV